MRLQVGQDGALMALSAEGGNRSPPGQGTSRTARRRRKRRERKELDGQLAAAKDVWRAKGWLRE